MGKSWMLSIKIQTVEAKQNKEKDERSKANTIGKGQGIQPSNWDAAVLTFRKHTFFGKR